LCPDCQKNSAKAPVFPENRFIIKADHLSGPISGMSKGPDDSKGSLTGFFPPGGVSQKPCRVHGGLAGANAASEKKQERENKNGKKCTRYRKEPAGP
jgi:hypothetical protein